MTGHQGNDDVVLTGLSDRLPESSCIEEFAQHLFGGVDLVTDDDRRWKVSDDLRKLPDRVERVDRLTELLVARGANVDKASVDNATQSFLRKLLLSKSYKPSGRLRGPVTLFKARDSLLALDEGLQAICEGELRTHQLAGTHRTIVTGDSGRAIADHVSELLAQH